MWNKIAKIGIEAGKAYIAHRGIDGAIDDAKKLFGMSDDSKRDHNQESNSTFISNLSLIEDEIDELPELDFEKVEQITNDCIAEMEAAFSEAKRHDITSLQFCQNANIALSTGYENIAKMECLEDEIDADDYDTLTTYTDSIDQICDQIHLYIAEKCQGGMNAPKDVNIGSNEGALCLQVYGVYPVNFDYNMIMLVAVVKNGVIKPGCTITLRGNDEDEDEETLAEVAFIKMFGKVLDQAESGDLCCIYLKGDFTDTFPNNCCFQIGQMPESHSESCIQINISESNNASEREYLGEVKACLEDGGEITARERRLLDKLSNSLGISAERAAELEKIATGKCGDLTDSEKEYIDEYKACLQGDGVISDRERRLLDRLAKSLDISPERVREIETYIS